MNEDETVFEHTFHPLGVGYEVGGEVAAVELHTLDDVEGRLERARLFHLDDAVLADLLHRLRDDAADGVVTVGGDGPDLPDHLAPHRLRVLLDLADDRLDGGVDSPLELHGIAAGGKIPEPLAVNGLCQDGRRGGAVTGHVGCLGCDLAHHLGAQVLDGVLELDLLGNGDAVLGDDRRAELLLENDVTALGAEGYAHSGRELVDTAENPLPCFLMINNLFCHFLNYLQAISRCRVRRPL